MATKIQMVKFNKKVEKIVLALGGIINATDPYKWAIDTKAGKLYITVHEPESSKVFSIFCIFDDPKLANEMLSSSNKTNLNIHSGKWNYHCSNESDCLEMFQNSVKEIESTTELAGLYDLRVPFGGNITINESISRAIRDCFLRHNGKIKKAVMDETIKAVGKNYPEYIAMWKDFKKTFEIKTKDGEYINPFHID